MKKYSFLFGVALGLATLASCEKEIAAPEQIEPTVKEGSVPFELKADIPSPDSKTTLNTSTWAVDWENGDIIYAVTTDAEWGEPYADDNSAESVAEFTYDSSKEIFSTTSTISDGEHTFNFLYSNGTQKSYHRGASTTHSLYSNQKFDASEPTANLKSYDALAAQLTATTPVNIAGVSMSHLYTMMKVTLKNKTGNDLTINKFELSADSETNLYGIFTVNFGETPSVSYSKNGSSTIAVDITNGEVANGSNLDVYFVMAPVTNYSGDIEFKATDSDGNTYSKTNTISGLSFNAGTYNTANFTLKAADVEEPYTFTSHDYVLATEIAVGDEIIIASGTSGNVAVMKHYEGSNNNYKKVDATVTSSTITSTEDMAVLTVGGESGNYTLYDPSTQLYVNVTSQTSKNQLKASASVDNYAKWSITFSSNAAVITGTGKASRNIIRYNNANDQLTFSAYSSGQQPVYIYKYSAPSPLVSIALSGSYKTEFYVNDSFTYEGLVVMATYDNGKTKVVTPTSVSSPDLSAVADNIAVTVSYTEGEVTATANYYVSVSSRPALTVTLGDDNSTLSATAGESVTLPTRSTYVEGYSFEGWSETGVTSLTATAPTIIAAGAYTVTKNVTLYPIFSKGESTTKWVQTSLDSVTEGDYILVTNNGQKVFNGTINSGHGQTSTTTVTFTDGSATTIPSDACVLTLTAVTGGFTMYNADNGYLYASKASSGGLGWQLTESNYWSYTSENWRYSKAYSSKYAYVRSYDNASFRTYSSNNGDLPILAKKTEVSTKQYISTPTE